MIQTNQANIKLPQIKLFTIIVSTINNGKVQIIKTNLSINQ